jgi:hypothetical protein
MTTLTAIRSVQTMSPLELRESAHRRIDAVAAKHGLNSPQVRAELARWGRALDAQATPDDTFALAASLGGAA